MCPTWIYQWNIDTNRLACYVYEFSMHQRTYICLSVGVKFVQRVMQCLEQSEVKVACSYQQSHRCHSISLLFDVFIILISLMNLVKVCIFMWHLWTSDIIILLHTVSGLNFICDDDWHADAAVREFYFFFFFFFYFYLPVILRHCFCSFILVTIQFIEVTK